MNRDHDFPSALVLERLSQAGDEFLIEFYEAEVQRHPTNVDALAELGQVLTRQGHFGRGLEVDRQLVRLVPDNPTVHYNLACSLARLGLLDESLDSLERAVELGYSDGGFMLADEDLESLRREQRFLSLVRRIEGLATA